MFNNKDLFKFDNRRVALFLIFAVMFVFTEIGRNIYRPYIYANDIFDFWIADTIGNFTGTITVIFFDLAIYNPSQVVRGRQLIAFVTIGLIVYELIQYILPKSRCDWRDIVATLIAGGISYIVHEVIYSK